MTLQIVDRPEFEAEVVVATRHLRGSFKARFIALPQSELDKLEELARHAGHGSEAILKGVCTWFETVKAPGGPIAFEDGFSVDKLVDYPGIGPAMLKAYYRGLWEEAEGN